MNNIVDNLTAQWSRVGAGFNTPPARTTSDLERLLLGTARHAPAMPRLFIMAATWLHRYGDLVAKGRLKRLIHAELASADAPVLGLLLNIAQEGTHPPQFQSILRVLPRDAAPRPLFDVENTSPAFADRARRNASPLSQTWGRWCAPFDFKDDALRPTAWIMSRNRGFISRADFRGDLRASILASLRHDLNAGESELALARECGGSRAQVRSALDNLAMTGRVMRAPSADGRRTRIYPLGEAA